MPPKAAGRDYTGRFREIVSDPLNLLIERAPMAGLVEDGLVWLHNGNRAPISGPAAYYGDFSEILIINRGVHEPLEEYVFQELLRRLPRAPLMLELGAYWGHYSMWLKKVRPEARVVMVEPKAAFLQAGEANFALNGFESRFIQGFVGVGQFEVDPFLASERISRLDVLHCDIQGFELEMIKGAAECLARKTADYIFISTHGQKTHHKVVNQLRTAGYRVEISSDFEGETTSSDGLVFASSPDKDPLFHGFAPLGREQICVTSSAALFDYLSRLVRPPAAGNPDPHVAVFADAAPGGDAEREIAALRQVLAQQPQDRGANATLGKLLFEAGKAAEAVPHLRIRADSVPTKRRPWERLASACEDAGLAEEAAGAWRHVLNVDPDDPAARQRLWLLSQGLQDQLADAGLSAPARQLKAKAVARLCDGDPAAAEPLFAQLARAHPEYPPAWLGLRGARHALGRPGSGAAVQREWEAAAPSSAGAAVPAMTRPLSPRGLVFDPRQSFPIRSPESLTRVQRPAELKAPGDAIFMVDPGGQELEFDPVITLRADRSDRIVARRTTIASYVMAFDDAMVVKNGLVINSSGEAIWPGGKFPFKKFQAEDHGGELRFVPGALKDGACGVKCFDQPALLLTGGNDQSFGDWIDDYPPKLTLAAAAELDCHVVIRSDPVPQFVEMLEALGISRERLLIHDVNGVSIFPRLYAPSWPVVDQRTMRGIFDVYGRMPARAPSAERPRIYLSRANIASRRPMMNEPEVRELFVRKGFHVVHPETLSFSQSLDLYANPACLAGPFGSAFHNLVFCERKPACLVLTPPLYHEHLETIAYFFGLWGARFAYVLGAPFDAAADRAGADPLAWTAPLDQVEAGIETLLEAESG